MREEARRGFEDAAVKTLLRETNDDPLYNLRKLAAKIQISGLLSNFCDEYGSLSNNLCTAVST